MESNKQHPFFFEDVASNEKQLQGTQCLDRSEAQRDANLVYPDPVIQDIFQSSANNEGLPELLDPSDQSEQLQDYHFSEPSCFVSDLNENPIMPQPQQDKNEDVKLQKVRKSVFKKCRKGTQYKNVARFFVRMIKEYAPEYFQRMNPETVEMIKRDLVDNEGFIPGIWNLIQFMDNEEYGQRASRINREVYHQILKKFSIQQMKHPKSQIKGNRVEYLRVAKVLALRCRHRSLISRFQSH